MLIVWNSNYVWTLFSIKIKIKKIIIKENKGIKKVLCKDSNSGLYMEYGLDFISVIESKI